MSVSPNHIVTVIQTRTGSTRLPGKSLLPLLGLPLFVQQVKRVQAASTAGKVVVATTTDKEDDAIEAICQQYEIDCFRGHPTDLLDRHYQAAKHFGATHVVKIPSDCPLIDPKVINDVIGYYGQHAEIFDFVSNLHPATWPDGNDVEIMSFNLLEQAWQSATKDYEREHTTPWIWDQPGKFRIGNVAMASGQDLSMTHRFTIDYKADYRFIEAVYAALYEKNPMFSCEDILQLLADQPGIFQINQEYAGVNWYRHHSNELQTISASQTKHIEA